MDATAERIAFTIICFPMFMLAIMLHEVAHGWVALKQGDPTAKYSGRLTLNPIDHIDVTGLFVFIVTSIIGTGFGWAKPVPINPLLFKEYKKGIILVSLAGVAANILQILFAAILLKIAIVAGVLELGTTGDYITRILMWYMMFNLVLVVFNLLPIPPLDGSKVLMMILPREQSMMLAKLEPYGFFIIFGLLSIGGLDVVFRFALNALHLGLGWFISI